MELVIIRLGKWTGKLYRILNKIDKQLAVDITTLKSRVRDQEDRLDLLEESFEDYKRNRSHPNL